MKSLLPRRFFPRFAAPRHSSRRWGAHRLGVEPLESRRLLAAVAVVPTTGLITTEAGGEAAFTVVLDAQPTADVTIDVSSDDTTEGTVSASSLTFTPADWNVAQTVTVTGVNDTLIDGDVAYTIDLAAAVSTDTNYGGLDPANVSATNNEDAVVAADPDRPGEQSLFITGTSQADTILVTQLIGGELQVTVNGVLSETFTTVSANGRVVVHAGDGADTVTLDASVTHDAAIFGEGGDDTIQSGSGDDELFGDDGNDEIHGGAGIDRILGLAGDDSLYGGPDLDVMSGGGGHDQLDGEDGNDILYGNGGGDGLWGHAGKDRLYGLRPEVQVGDKENILVGGDGNDRIVGGPKRDVILAGMGVDDVLGKEGEDLIAGGPTSYDNDVEALAALLAEWLKTDAMEARMTTLLATTGFGPDDAGNPGNKMYHLAVDTVLADDAKDTLAGNLDGDWYLENAPIDSTRLDAVQLVGRLLPGGDRQTTF